MRLTTLCPRPRDRSDLLRALASARGCRTDAECADFIAAAPALDNPLARYPAYGALRDRVARALGRRERICLFGDYDADGITSLAQMQRWWQTAGDPELAGLHAFVPDRARHDYGLSSAAVKECLAECRALWGALPSLIIALDCGSTARSVIGNLREEGIDCIVIDHHSVEDGEEEQHPAVAHLNPRAWAGDDEVLSDLRRMSAAGLAFLVCERLACDLALSLRRPWDRELSLLLAGVGTVVDVMPLLGRNRALVKGTLRAANEPDEPGGRSALERIPGLRALHAKSGGGTVDVRTLGYQWGPRLNAPGRMGSAAPPLRLLLTEDPREAEEIAAACDAINRTRQEITLRTELEALAEAEELLRADPPPAILALGRESWDPGIVGIVAGRLRERFHRPAIVCGLNRSDGCWKGSGRGVEGHDLGAEIRAAVEAGLALRGGGHALAAGLSVDADRFEELRTWLNARCRLTTDDLVPRREVLTELTLPGITWSEAWGGNGDGGAALPAAGERLDDPRRDATRLTRFWLSLLSSLEPFGAANPKPALLLRGAILRHGPTAKTRRADGSTWALSAGFDFGGQGYLFAEWTDVERARQLWGVERIAEEPSEDGIARASARFDLVLVPTRSAKKGGNGDPYWYGWRVLDAVRSGSDSGP